MPSPTQNRGASYFGIQPQSYGSYFPPVVPPFPDTSYGQQGSTELDLEDAYRNRSLSAQKDFQNTDLDDENYPSALARVVAAGGLTPSAGNTLLRGYHYANPTPRSGRNSPLGDANAQTALNLLAPDFNWSDADAPQKFRAIVQQNPSFLSTPQGINIAQNFQNHRLSYKPPAANKDIEFQMAMAGIDPKTFDQYRDETGVIDPTQAAYAISQAKSGMAKAPNAHQSQELLEGLRSLSQEPTDEDAMAAFNQKNKTTLGTGHWFGGNISPDQLAQGRQFAKEQKINDLANTISSFQDAGIKIPQALKDQFSVATKPPASEFHASPVAVPGAPPVSAPSMPQIPAFNSPEEAESANIPVGTIVTINGRKFKKT